MGIAVTRTVQINCVEKGIKATLNILNKLNLNKNTFKVTSITLKTVKRIEKLEKSSFHVVTETNSVVTFLYGESPIKKAQGIPKKNMVE